MYLCVVQNMSVPCTSIGLNDSLVLHNARAEGALWTTCQGIKQR